MRIAGRINARWSMVAAVFVCVLVMVPAALASEVHIRIERVFYTAAAGETNDLDVTVNSTNFILFDAGAQVNPGPGCIASNNTATCPVDKHQRAHYQPRRRSRPRRQHDFRTVHAVGR